MKNLLRVAGSLALWVILIGQAVAAEPKPLHVLFIGNSYTSVNSLPTIFQEMAASAGYPKPVVGASVPGGFTLAKHFDNEKTLGLIDRGAADGARWDVVILQEQSQTPALAEQFAEVRASFLGGVTNLCQRIKEKNPQARVVFYETWARHAELWEKNGKSLAPLGADAVEMQRRLRKWYEEAARLCGGAGIARAGDFWEANYRSATPVRLHAGDGSHPAFAGSYVAGLAIFATVYDASPLKVSYAGKLSETEAANLRKFAATSPRGP